jgi:hypothetical protein
MSAQDTVAIDIARVDWFDAFFSRMGSPSAEKILEAIGAADVDLQALEETGDLAEMAMSGWAYWTLYIKGYLDYSAGGQVTWDNVYLRYLVGYFGPRNHDPGLRETLVDPNAAVHRVALRYRDFDRFRNLQTSHPNGSPIDPPVLTIVDPPPDHAKVVYEAGTGREVLPAVVDGYHRIFLARLFGARDLKAQVMVAAGASQLL